MIQKKGFKIAELIVLFVCVPVSLALDISIIFKLATVACGITYAVWISIHLKLISKKDLIAIDVKASAQRVLLTFGLVCIASFCFMYFLYPENLFIVVKKAPILWITILFVYAFFSVYPQELLYRSFYFSRYSGLFKTNALILINIIIFPVAHFLFNNELVLLVTLIGGALFTLSYYKTHSVLLTSIEHALYGNVLFTVGMGEMLAFPMPN